MSLLSSWEDMDITVKLLADYAWAAEYCKTSFLNVGVDCLIFKYDQYPWPGCRLVLKHINMINEDKWEIWKNGKMTFFDKWSILLLDPSYEKYQKVEKCQTFHFDECSKIFFDAICYT